MSATIIRAIVARNITALSPQEQWPDSVIIQFGHSTHERHSLRCQMALKKPISVLYTPSFLTDMRCCFRVISRGVCRSVRIFMLLHSGIKHVRTSGAGVEFEKI